MRPDDHALLRTALDQLAGLLDDVRPDRSAAPTPCRDWTLTELVDHVVATPGRFATMLRGGRVDWAAPTPPAGADPAGAFRSHAQSLLDAWRDQDASAGATAQPWQCAELAVHTWDLATALGRPTADLDPAVAEAGMAFLRANLTSGNRGAAFGAELQAPAGADAYGRLAAYAGREV